MKLKERDRERERGKGEEREGMMRRKGREEREMEGSRGEANTVDKTREKEKTCIT